MENQPVQIDANLALSNLGQDVGTRAVELAVARAENTTLRERVAQLEQVNAELVDQLEGSADKKPDGDA